MEIGFDTIGNAILICYDERPVLVTDPWLTDSSYFGSWGHSHEIPEEQSQAIQNAEYVWVSHGHPDHLDSRSLRGFGNKKILLPDHVGQRIANGIRQYNPNVVVMKDRVWMPLSKRIRVMCISDFNQDAVLLIDLNGRLIFNQNDSGDNGWEHFVRREIKKYKLSFRLALSRKYPDADMINFFDEDGNRIPPQPKRLPLGKINAHETEAMGARFFVPFSSMNVYQREDSLWARFMYTSPEDYLDGFESKTVDGLPAFLRYDCARDTYDEIRPKERPLVVRKPAEFGDDWDEPLEKEDVAAASEYFQGIHHLSTFLDYINLRVGGRDNVIKISSRTFDRGITFEAPRNSLMTTVRYRIFDDMLIGNFMKTTLHGDWSPGRLYPDFAPYVAKYADNGLARSKEDLEAYMKTYRDRAFLDYLRHSFERSGEAIYRSLVAENSAVHRVAKKAYWHYKKVLR